MKRWLFKPKNTPVPVQRPLPSLAACIAMDLIGYVSFGIPILGELIDIIWAPISAAIYYRMFGGKIGILGGAFDFLEEILPGTDIIPTFTITWVIQYIRRRKPSTVTYSAVR
jgi:hypothetical protein